eukprot:TRINITY_DN22934_c0_g1_i1.p1 TRINITY_DN22934_c0_g1~~TRINITY_DN22934_c0_g1_i1.p1  ORF type:complete len:165 (-),score=29.88 TRINITY_DN22934_c0_g1_i1:122-616(-)
MQFQTIESTQRTNSTHNINKLSNSFWYHNRRQKRELREKAYLAGYEKGKKEANSLISARLRLGYSLGIFHCALNVLGRREGIIPLLPEVNSTAQQIMKEAKNLISHLEHQNRQILEENKKVKEEIEKIFKIAIFRAVDLGTPVSIPSLYQPSKKRKRTSHFIPE